MALGVSVAMQRLLRSLQAKRRQLDANDRQCQDLKSPAENAKTVTLPRALFRQIRGLVNDTAAIAGGSEKTKQKSSVSPKVLGRIAAPLVDSSSVLLKAFPSTTTMVTTGTMRTAPLNVVTQYLLRLWECLLYTLDNPSSASSRQQESGVTKSNRFSADDASRVQDAKSLQLAILSLVQIIVSRPEFDQVLVMLAKGECGGHGPKEVRHRRLTNEARRSSQADRRSSKARRSSRVSATISRPKRMKPASLKKHKGQAELPWCTLVREYVQLQEDTLRVLADTRAKRSRTDASVWGEELPNQERELIACLLSTSFTRLPPLRQQILQVLQTELGAYQDHRVRAKLPDIYNDSVSSTPAEVFTWMEKLDGTCDCGLSPLGSADCWLQMEPYVRAAVGNEGCKARFAGYLLHTMGALQRKRSRTGVSKWEQVAGFQVLRQFVHSVIHTFYQSQLAAVEVLSGQADALEGIDSENESPLGENFSLEPRKGTAMAFFFQELKEQMKYSSFLALEMLQVILEGTNCYVPYHVELCIQHFEKLIEDFPAVFSREPSEAPESSQHLTFLSPEVMRYVFKGLLESEHFMILKSTQLFLLRYYDSFSKSVQSELRTLIEEQFCRLFLHWQRDVRFCYHHILLYQTYQGNRLNLCAKSDESLLGPEASRLFEIQTLMAKPTEDNWQYLDERVCQVLDSYNRRRPHTAAHADRRSLQMPESSGKMTVLAGRSSCGGSSSGQKKQTRVRQGKQFGHKKTMKRPQSCPQILSWADKIPLDRLQHCVQEYKSHVCTYYALAQQISISEPVPPPSFDSRPPPRASS